MYYNKLNIIHLYTNKIALYFTLLKQHIEIAVLFKSPNNSPTCFGQFLTILRDIFIFLRQLLKINFLGLWKHVVLVFCVDSAYPP